MSHQTSTSRSPLVQVEDLYHQLRGAAGPLLIDMRPADQFARGSIPGALHLDLWGVSLIDTSEAPLRAFMWMIGHLFALRGVVPERPVVVFEADSGVRAARAFWLLEALGHPDTRVLDGGSEAWLRAGFALSTEPAAPVAGSWQPTPDRSRVATWQDTRAALGRADTCVLDTRSDDEYTGRVARARRAGAIPGAVHLEWTHNLDADGRYRAPEALAGMYAARGVTADREIITYCQGGYRAAHSYLALRVLGYPRVRTYTGSWKEWGDREDLPIANTRPDL